MDHEEDMSSRSNQGPQCCDYHMNVLFIMKSSKNYKNSVFPIDVLATAQKFHSLLLFSKVMLHAVQADAQWKLLQELCTCHSEELQSSQFLKSFLYPVDEAWEPPHLPR